MRDLHQGFSEVRRVLDLGRELVENRPGATLIKSQLDDVTIRWDSINKLSKERLIALEERLSESYQSQSTKLITWLKRVDADVTKYDSDHPKRVQIYIKVREESKDSTTYIL